MELSKLFDVIGGGTPKTSEESYWGGDIPWLSVKDFNGDKKYVYITEKTITKKGLENSSTKLLYKDDIIVSARGTVGEIAMIPFPMAFNQSCFGLKVKDGNDAAFVYYLVKYKLSELKAQAQGSVFDTIIKTTFDNIECKEYSLAIQRRISSILSSLDSKIETNNKINAKLEEMAQALFKSWFVDFEPFKDEEMVESELGMIPKGWSFERIVDIAQKVASGGTPKSMNDNYYNGEIKWYSTKELKDSFLLDSEKHISLDAYNNSSAKFFPPYTILMAIYAAPTVGRLGILTEEACFNQAAVGIIPNQNIGYPFLYLTLKSERTNLNNLASGAAQQNLNVGIVKNYKVLVPSENICKMFNHMVLPLFEEIKTLQSESHLLSSLRDTLLPKLMSGEINLD